MSQNITLISLNVTSDVTCFGCVGIKAFKPSSDIGDTE